MRAALHCRGSSWRGLPEPCRAAWLPLARPSWRVTRGELSRRRAVLWCCRGSVGWVERQRYPSRRHRPARQPSLTRTWWVAPSSSIFKPSGRSPHHHPVDRGGNERRGRRRRVLDRDLIARGPESHRHLEMPARPSGCTGRACRTLAFACAARGCSRCRRGTSSRPSRCTRSSRRGRHAAAAE